MLHGSHLEFKPCLKILFKCRSLFLVKYVNTFQYFRFYIAWKTSCSALYARHKICQIKALNHSKTRKISESWSGYSLINAYSNVDGTLIAGKYSKILHKIDQGQHIWYTVKFISQLTSKLVDLQSKYPTNWKNLSSL